MMGTNSIQHVRSLVVECTDIESTDIFWKHQQMNEKRKSVWLDETGFTLHSTVIRCCVYLAYVGVR